VEKETQDVATSSGEVNLNGLFLFKEGMASVYTDAGELVPVTVLRYESHYITQVKTKTKDGYDAVQVSLDVLKVKNADKARAGHCKKAGLDKSLRISRELPTDGKAELTLGAKVGINSFKTGDTVIMTGTSKGHGFCGSVRRHNFAGGPASHGSKFHRRPGSSGNRTWPGRVMPGKKFPGHYGDERITVKNVKVICARRID
jgi:large subunit ribosomal protein L3